MYWYGGKDLVAAGRAVTEAAATALLGLGLVDLVDGDGDGVELEIEEYKSAYYHTPQTHNEDFCWMGQEKTYAEVLEQSLGVLVDLELARLVVLGEVESRDLRNVLVLALTLLLLKLEGDTADGTLLDTLHQVGGVTGNLFRTLSIFLLSFCRIRRTAFVCKTHLVAKALGSNDGNLIANALVGLEVQGELGVVPLNDDLGGLLNGLGANATHLDGW